MILSPPPPAPNQAALVLEDLRRELKLKPELYFTAVPSMSFAPSPVHRLEWQDEQGWQEGKAWRDLRDCEDERAIHALRLSLSGMGMLGTSGTMPFPMTSLVISQMRNNEHGLADFIAMLENSVFRLQFETLWELAPECAPAQRPTEQPFADAFYAIAGVLTDGLRGTRIHTPSSSPEQGMLCPAEKRPDAPVFSEKIGKGTARFGNTTANLGNDTEKYGNATATHGNTTATHGNATENHSSTTKNLGNATATHGNDTSKIGSATATHGNATAKFGSTAATAAQKHEYLPAHESSTGTVPDALFLACAPIWGQQVRTAAGLEKIIATAFGVHAQVIPFRGAWVELPQEYRTRLGGTNTHRGMNPTKGMNAHNEMLTHKRTNIRRGTNANSEMPTNAEPIGSTRQNTTLGDNVLLGRHMWDASAAVTLCLGSLTEEQRRDFLPPPAGQLRGQLMAIVRWYLGDSVGCIVEI